MTIEVSTLGRTSEVLAIQPRDGAPLQKKRTAISGGEGEGAAEDSVLTSAVVGEEIGEVSESPVVARDDAGAAVEEPFRIVRASTRFEIRIRPRKDDDMPDEKGLALLKALDAISQDIARARNAAVRANMLADGAWLDAHPEIIAAWKRGEKKLPWWGDRAKTRNAAMNPNGVYSYPIMRRAAPDVSPDIIAQLQKGDDAEWMGSRFDVLVRCAKAPRHYKPHQPIAVPHKAVALVATDDNSAEITFRFQSTNVEDAARVTLKLVGRDAWQREELQALCTKEWKLGTVVLSRHPTKRGRWFVRFAYTRLVPRVETGGVVVVRRGMRSFLVAASSNGTVREIYDGGDIVRFKMQMDARRRSLGRHTRAGTMGQGGTGHGTKRRVGALIELSDKEARFAKSASQRAAAALVRFAQAEGAKEIVLEDFAAPKREGTFWLIRRWPWYQLGEACTHAAESAGMITRAVIVSNDRRVCPACKHFHVAPPVTNSVWECEKCGMKRSVDQVDALGMLRAIDEGAAISRAETRRRSATKIIASAMVPPKPPEALEGAEPPKPNGDSGSLGSDSAGPAPKKGGARKPPGKGSK